MVPVFSFRILICKQELQNPLLDASIRLLRASNMWVFASAQRFIYVTLAKSFNLILVYGGEMHGTPPQQIKIWPDKINAAASLEILSIYHWAM